MGRPYVFSVEVSRSECPTYPPDLSNLLEVDPSIFSCSDPVLVKRFDLLVTPVMPID